ncbi:uncharacterized protein LOC135119494 [Zophobas morio]|uniref:uncharacterized protein LOC135119494 n=1 Tax=Zophobas morio TaxID=2755281 RepID=UPI0030838F66
MRNSKSSPLYIYFTINSFMEEQLLLNNELVTWKVDFDGVDATPLRSFYTFLNELTLQLPQINFSELLHLCVIPHYYSFEELESQKNFFENLNSIFKNYSQFNENLNTSFPALQNVLPPFSEPHSFYHFSMQYNPDSGSLLGDLLIKRALQDEKEFHSIPDLAPLISGAFSLLLTDLINADTRYEHRIYTRFTLMLCYFQLRVDHKKTHGNFPHNSGQLSEFPYIATVVTGNRAHLELLLKFSSEVMNEHVSRSKVLSMFFKTIDSIFPNFTAELMDETFPNLTISGRLALPKALGYKAHLLVQLPCVRFVHLHSREGLQDDFDWRDTLKNTEFDLLIEKCQLREFLGVIQLLSHNKNYLLAEGGQRFLDIVGLSVRHNDQLVPFYVSECATGAEYSTKSLLFTSRLYYSDVTTTARDITENLYIKALFCILFVLCLSLLCSYFFLGYAIHLLTLTEPRLRVFVPIRTRRLTLYRPVLAPANVLLGLISIISVLIGYQFQFLIRRRTAPNNNNSNTNNSSTFTNNNGDRDSNSYNSNHNNIENSDNNSNNSSNLVGNSNSNSSSESNNQIHNNNGSINYNNENNDKKFYENNCNNSNVD